MLFEKNNYVKVYVFEQFFRNLASYDVKLVVMGNFSPYIIRLGNDE
jgi:hypothetical protein